MKQAPSPSWLATATVPPSSSAICLTMARPSPVPSNLRARLLSTWLKAWKSFPMSSLEMPMPPSVTLISRNSSRSLSAKGKLCTGQVPCSMPTQPRGTRLARRATRPPCSLNFTAFDSRL